VVAVTVAVKQLVGIVAAAVAVAAVGQDNKDSRQLSTKALPVALYQALHLSNPI